MSNTLGDLLQNHSYLKLQPNNKILCSLTNHEMSANYDIVSSYINGKKFKKAIEWYQYDFIEFLPYIVVDKINPKLMYCKLTKTNLNKIPNEIKKHMNGKRFRRLKEEYEQSKANSSDDDNNSILKELEELNDKDDNNNRSNKKQRKVIKDIDTMSDLMDPDDINNNDNNSKNNDDNSNNNDNNSNNEDDEDIINADDED